MGSKVYGLATSTMGSKNDGVERAGNTGPESVQVNGGPPLVEYRARECSSQWRPSIGKAVRWYEDGITNLGIWAVAGGITTLGGQMTILEPRTSHRRIVATSYYYKCPQA